MTSETSGPQISESETPSLAEEVSSSDESETKNAQTFLFFLLGNASLYSFNVILGAIDLYTYFTKENLGGYLARSYNIPSSAVALLLCFFNFKNSIVSISYGLSVLIIIMLAMTILIGVANHPSLIKTTAGVGVGFLGVFSSLVFSSSISASSAFGPAASAAFSSGQGCAGVLANLLRIVTKAIWPDMVTSGIIYFSSCILVLVLTLVYFFFKTRTLKDEFIVSEETVENDGTTWIDTIRVVWTQLLGIFICFFITLNLFPAYVCGVRQPQYLGDWTFVIITSVFCIFDWVGRYCPALFMWPPEKWSLAPNVSRVLFYVTFMLSIQGVINVGEPWWTIALMVPFAFSNGYFSTVSLIYAANSDELKPGQKRLSGFLIGFAINFGIILASFAQYLLPKPHPLPFIK